MEPFEKVIDLFLAGRLPRLNHERHIAVASILLRRPHGRELMHLGLQVTATRHGVPEKYSRAMTDRYLDELSSPLVPLPSVEEFSDVLVS